MKRSDQAKTVSAVVNNMKSNNKPIISVVIPVYGVEKYLAECLDSVLAQTLKNIEILAVDDGSPDHCGEILDEYAKKDSRIIAIHQKNGGYGAAVNAGLVKVRGEYTAIVEPDDIIEPDMYERLYESAKKYDTDVTKGGFWKYNSYESGYRRNWFWTNAMGIDLRNAPEGAFKLTDWPKLIGFHASVWSCIYRTKFLKDNNIKMLAGKGVYYQDFPWMVECMSKAKRISVVKDAFYHWRNEPNQNNSTNVKTQKNGKKLIEQARTMSPKGIEIVKRLGIYDQVKEPLMVHVLWANYGFFMHIEKDWRERYFNALKKLFAGLDQDETFQWRFFSPYEKSFVIALLHESWPTFSRRMFLRRVKSGLKNRVKMVAFAISPSYKALNYIKAQNYDLIDRNNMMQSSLDEMRGEIALLRKK